MKTLITLLSSLLIVSSLSACQSGSSALPLTSVVRLQAQASSRVVYHVVPDAKSGTWLIKREGIAQAVGSFRTKEEAVAAGRAFGRSHALGQLIVHKANGQIEIEYTYGNDPAHTVG
ncbi:hypothetical protein COW36_09770 [bacterium (Candidatus Blackallbacteria) CG17_big_fil_post_rev_8_21_14_2_50_48_46]|uniref:DUF2188 domain-containing protein n=1 Tax=bacterium (Candidatus Blackallbacteria) CG17_big_fil_post_rev_8_21_14_2_50_48_46 TaxID=2014261 RepID=A0A2M7G5W6_9BACT|nr:MAG: hypothetical protein COW64_01640 [bacterium (Candidatus Blackallbacteria) CG18_big_fil_WC_8_21_14_2_50_49_26]PIW17247.1 MAG: hypothetical protein COW36_09770 [bacterium (Candidatus Blackallbacteria) CG17_big_fil_post_rev_8_21_14_2_50_48_46]PIW51039.1 MAG: hypothetical protein COW20_00780 [bacterium (Candidatus Blackallbacteria) CG13_big_fil_rev_8_21_14_2_50_49_14]